MLPGPVLAQPKPPPLGVEPGTLPPKPPPAGAPARPGRAASGPGSKPPPLPPGGGPFGEGGRRATASGTGFVVAPGRLLTNHHVANGCTEMRARSAGGTELVATVTATDAERDLALLAVRGDAGQGGLGPALTFRSGPEVRRGEGVVTYGFPPGRAAFLRAHPDHGRDLGPGRAARQSPAIPDQRAGAAGDSGGPLLDHGGHVVGVVVSKLNAQRVAQSTGDIPQNVNFAVKGTEAIEFLQSNGVRPLLAATAGPPRSAAEVGEVAHPSTLFLRCMR
ncbi:serine protease [Siccirubricoccus sp. G192]|uniref:S1 family peptidase n=1 Tax=Siccirubricoccus sp. G192 TaxID=2849651 RepID=UPI001C2BC299|nr:serine protease [Siccirubricoccus sp. G192]MBV1796428.1 serine protease [Siccirubricoccus sp. G192]